LNTGANESNFNSVNGEDENILLSKEANLEQLQIAKRLEKCGAVLVQGPPGTGKTHTIANLIGHLLAQGKSILVSSHTTKALKVLHDKIVPALQPLCVSVMDESRQQMEKSIDAITEYLSSYNAESLEREAEDLTKQRKMILKLLREERVLLLNARNDEYRAIVIAGEEYTPANAGRFIAKNRNDSSWIPSSVVLGEPLPLSKSELITLYHSNKKVTLDDERELDFELPNPNKLLLPSIFKHITDSRNELQNTDLNYRTDFWSKVSNEQSIEKLENNLTNLRKAVEPLKNETGWETAAILAGKDGGDYRKKWDLLLSKVEELNELALKSQEILFNHNPFIPEELFNDRLETVLSEIHQHLIEKGKISKVLLLVKSEWKIIEKLPSVLIAQINRIKWNDINTSIQNSLKKVGVSESSFEEAEVISNLRSSLIDLNYENYAKSYERLVELHLRYTDLQERKNLLAKLEKVAPDWANGIKNRTGSHGCFELPGEPQQAWIWRQLNDEIDKRSKTSLEELQKNIENYSMQLRTVTTQLIEKKAWASQLRRTSLNQRMALMGWKDMIKKTGKGTGKRVPRLLAEARKKMLECQSAVPVWIMPLSRVAENFDPRRNKFDVVIIDEASQADIMALTALYLGKQVIVVGDDEQVSPLAVGIKSEVTQKLMDEYLKDIPNGILYDELTSVYDLAKRSFEPICLREHFRCVSPIIQFSNAMSYGWKIKPLRESGNIKTKPHTIPHRVDNAYSNNKINEKEAYTIASLVYSCIQQPEYKEATFGVISLVGEEQANLIDTILRKVLPETEYVRRKIQCGNSAQFQGDERDIIFLSVVDAPTGTGPLFLKAFGANDMYKKRYNVAASRARDQMWVVHSLNVETDLKPNDIRLSIIQHAMDPSAKEKLLENIECEAESEFERLVIRGLNQNGYKVKSQWKVGSYRIDMVVTSGKKRVAVECDGEKWHTREKLEEDMARQAILERLGWKFI
jgi:superfamily I DNA and/or RNA helicase/very-short-patch-repair endonuclease